MDNQVKMRCAIYARYSSDNQRETSLDDQIRKCREFADSKGWQVLQQHIYRDQALSGAGLDRPGLNALLDLAFRQSKAAFDVVLVDDTSRLSRDLADAVRLSQRLRFEGIRLVVVSQGIDSSEEQSDVMFTVHGLVDSLFLRELAKKTHRGLEGNALKGLHTGGRCFGYDVVDAPEQRKRYAVNKVEADVIRRIFEMAAAGGSLKKIAKTLNLEGVPSPRPGTRKKYDSWCPSAIRDMLRREIYIGRLVWNKSMWVKAPGTNRRVRRARPQSEWRVVMLPELRIVSDEVWKAVQEKNCRTMAKYSTGGRKGLLGRAQTSPYIMTGFLVCGACGAHLTITSGRGGKYARYGCPQHFQRGVCSNAITIPVQTVEQTFFRQLQEYALSPEALEFTYSEFLKQMEQATENATSQAEHLLKEKQAVECEIERLTAAITEGVPARTLKEAFSQREHKLLDIERKLSSLKTGRCSFDLLELRKFACTKIFDLVSLLHVHRERTKHELGKHLTSLRMVPTLGTDGTKFYVGQGEWDLLGELPNAPSRDMAFPSKALSQQEGLRQVNSGDCCIRMVAGGGFEPPTFGL